MMKERLDKLAAEVDKAIKRVNSYKAILRWVTVENINLEAIRVRQVRKIRKLKAALKVA